jgi:uncharacterized membrane protein
MKPAERKRILEVWQRDCLDLEDHIEELARLFETADCGLMRAIYTALDHYTERVAELISAEAEVLKWYAHECKYGREAKVMQHEDGRTVVVKDLGTLIETLDW